MNDEEVRKQPEMAEEKVDQVSAAIIYPRKEKREDHPLFTKLKTDFEYFCLASLGFGFLYMACLYENPIGIAIPVFIAGAYGIAFMIIKRLGIDWKKDSILLAGVSVLIGFASCRTGSWVLIIFNRIAVILIAYIFILHQFYSDKNWNIGKYMGAIAVFFCYAIGCIGYPFVYFKKFIHSLNGTKYKNIMMALLGIVIGLPVVIILAVLLGQADLVFQKLMNQLLETYLNPFTIIKAAWKWGVGTVICFCLICSACIHNISENSADRRKGEPVFAITGMGIISCVYLLFSVIQIFYLFLGKGTLPEGVSYSQYARQGFFQLLFVAFLNLIMVLCCIKYFRKSKVLNGVLAVVCLCTYAMIASAFYRMLLYIGEHHLTFLRVFVLWFLVLLSVLMAGVAAVIFNNNFRLFRYCLAVVSVFYLIFTWMKPDLIIARYNVAHISKLDGGDLDLFFENLSVDAAPVIAEIKDEKVVSGFSGYKELYYNHKIKYYNLDMSPRTFNFSYAKANQAFLPLIKSGKIKTE